MNWLLAFAIAVAVVMLLLMTVSMARAEPVCMDAAMREQVRRLMLEGLDQALKDHVGKLFDVWVRDRASEPKRAIAGTQSAVNGYVRSRAAAMRWTAPLCER